MRKRLFLTLILLAVLQTGFAKGVAVENLVMLGPQDSLVKQIKYLQSTWPDQFASVVLETTQHPICFVKENVENCTAAVKPLDFIIAKWLNSSPRAPGHEFRIHYWYKKKKKKLPIQVGEQLIAFLAPTHEQGVYSCTILMLSSEARIKSLRNTLQEMQVE